MNTFTEGMLMDLNPINTPNNVLTDCLNGTILTYNGNEHILQNDQGNYKLQFGKLPPNFIPVGIKEYGGIIYIISHNPLTKETEVGSYPSPKTIFTTKDRDQVTMFSPIIPTELMDSSGAVETSYEKLIQTTSLQIYALSDNMDMYKLNPGDKFIIELDNKEVFPYQEIQFQLMTEDKTMIELDKTTNEMIDEGYIVPNGTNADDEDFKSVFWNTPGWLTGQYRLALMDEFNMYLKSITLPAFSPGETFAIPSIQLNSSFLITDRLLVDSPTVANDLHIEYKAYRLVGSDLANKEELSILGETTYTTANLEKYAITDAMVNLYHNLEFSIPESIGCVVDDTILIEAVPYIEYNGHVIYYNQFKYSLELPLNSVSNASDISIADSIYKYSVDDEYLTLAFNINGPFQSSSGITLDCHLYNATSSAITECKNFQLLDPNVSGSNVVTVAFDNIDSTSDSSFTKENIYLLEVLLKLGEEVLSSAYRLVVASELMNPFYNSVSDFSTISQDEWVSQLETVYNASLPEFTLEEPVIGNAAPTWTGLDTKFTIADRYITEAYDGSYELNKNTKYTSVYGWLVTDRNTTPPKYKLSKNISVSISAKKQIKGKLWEGCVIGNSIIGNVTLGESVEKNKTLLNYNTEGSVDYLSSFGITLDGRYNFLSNKEAIVDYSRTGVKTNNSFLSGWGRDTSDWNSIDFYIKEKAINMENLNLTNGTRIHELNIESDYDGQNGDDGDASTNSASAKYREFLTNKEIDYVLAYLGLRGDKHHHVDYGDDKDINSGYVGITGIFVRTTSSARKAFFIPFYGGTEEFPATTNIILGRDDDASSIGSPDKIKPIITALNSISNTKILGTFYGYFFGLEYAKKTDNSFSINKIKNEWTLNKWTLNGTSIFNSQFNIATKVNNFINNKVSESDNYNISFALNLTVNASVKKPVGSLDLNSFLNVDLSEHYTNDKFIKADYLQQFLNTYVSGESSNEYDAFKLDTITKDSPKLTYTSNGLSAVQKKAFDNIVSTLTLDSNNYITINASKTSILRIQYNRDPNVDPRGYKADDRFVVGYVNSSKQQGALYIPLD